MSDTGRRRAVVFVSLATASSLLGDQMLYAVLPSYYGELGLHPWQVGLLLSANRIVRLATNHLAERATRLWAPAVLMSVALSVGAGLNLVYGFVAAFPLLLAARVVWGVCWSVIRQIGLMTIVEQSVEQHVGRAMGYYAGISRMGSISGNLLGALGHDLIGFTATLAIFAVASLLMAPLGPVACRVERPRQVSPSGTMGRAGLALATCGFVSGAVGQGLLASTLGAVVAARQPDGVAWMLFGSPVTLGVATLTGSLLAMRWITDLAAPLLGMSIDRFGPRRTGTAYFLVGAVALGAAAATDGLPGLVLCVLLFYGSAAGVGVVLNAMAGRRGPRAIAGYVTASDLGSATGPNLGWLVLQAGIAVHGVFLLGATLYLAAGIVALGWLRHTLSQEAE